MVNNLKKPIFILPELYYLSKLLCLYPDNVKNSTKSKYVIGKVTLTIILIILSYVAKSYIIIIKNIHFLPSSIIMEAVFFALFISNLICIQLHPAEWELLFNTDKIEVHHRFVKIRIFFYTAICWFWLGRILSTSTVYSLYGWSILELLAYYMANHYIQFSMLIMYLMVFSLMNHLCKRLECVKRKFGFLKYQNICLISISKETDECILSVLEVLKRIKFISKIYGLQILLSSGAIVLYFVQFYIFHDLGGKKFSELMGYITSMINIWIMPLFITVPYKRFKLEIEEIERLFNVEFQSLPSSTSGEYLKHKILLLIQQIKLQQPFLTAAGFFESTDVDEYDKRWEFISGFSGSYSNIIITADKAALWTDGRFHLQADEQIDCNWLLFREGRQKIKTMSTWLKEQLPTGGRFGMNPKLVSEHMWNKLSNELRGSRIELVGLNVSLVDIIWPEDFRKARRSKEVFFLNKEYTGKNYTIKVNETRKELLKHGADAMVITALDEIAWLLNIRGRDVPNSPYVRSYIILDMQNVFLYVNESQVPQNVRDQLHYDSRIFRSDTVFLKDYEQIWPDLGTKSQRYKKILIPSHCVYSEGASHAIYEHIFSDRRMVRQSPIIYLKAVKNPVEIKWMQYTNIKDAAAVCDCFAHIQKKMDANDKLMETDLVQYLNEYRYEQNHSLGNSFRTRVGFAANSAFPNYEPTANTNIQIFKNSTLVLDSGGQYYGGTTEVTRTLHFGEPADEMKEAYTRVLIGLIQLSTLTFPSNMKMAVADSVARAALWEVGLDYLHETGHGIGSFLGVDESPINVHFSSEVSTQQTFKPGYFLSNGPGYYREGVFGVRLENILQVVEKPWLKQIGQTYLGFRTITYVPFEPNLIKLNLLSTSQRKWLNTHNEQIRHLVGEELKKQKRMDGFYWMMDKTQYIPENNSYTFSSMPYIIIVLNLFLIFNIL